MVTAPNLCGLPLSDYAGANYDAPGNYTTDDFSPVFGPDEKPVRPGWYASTCSERVLSACLRTNTFPYWSWKYYDGQRWRINVQGGLTIIQRRYWFGLKEKAVTTRRIGCHAKQVNDQMVCGRCGLQWDVDDTDPPECANKSTNSGECNRDEQRSVKPVGDIRGGACGRNGSRVRGVRDTRCVEHSGRHVRRG